MKGEHMIRLSANLSKKIPIGGVQFSSQQFGAAMEIEVGDGDKPEAIKERIRELYSMLSNAIDEQLLGEREKRIRNGSHTPDSPAARSDAAYGNGRNPRNGRATGNGRRLNATEAQCRAIHAICKSLGTEIASALADYNVARVEDLNVRDASRLIDELKATQNTPPSRR